VLAKLLLLEAKYASQGKEGNEEISGCKRPLCSVLSAGRPQSYFSESMKCVSRTVCRLEIAVLDSQIGKRKQRNNCFVAFP